MFPKRRPLARLIAAAGIVATLVVSTACSPSALTSNASPVRASTTLGPDLTAPRPSASAAQVRPPAPRTTAKPAPKPQPKPASTGALTVNSAGAILPNHARTPGATNPAVSQANINSTICRSGWTATIRPPESYTTGLKEQQLATGYAYHGDTHTSDYEEDHLISLEIGGSPTSVANLWPEPYQATDGARTKDGIENKLNELVCSHAISLATAQHAIAGNWYTAYLHYIGTPPAPTTRSTPSTHHTTAPPPPPAAPGPPAGATARCNDGTYSYAAHHQGACSHHGGVAIFYK